jgi:AcrR family transcriptional regulator
MTDAAAPRPYHHGDLRQGLIDAARAILEREGAGALSLRAVAREAGVSPAAPYHHFKDKTELLEAVALEGWEMLDEVMGRARACDDRDERMADASVAYVLFARDHPELYRLMYDTTRDKAELPAALGSNNASSPYSKVRETLIRAGVDPDDHVRLELATIAAWCSAHGLAELSGFRQFDALKKEVGGEEAFIRGVMQSMGLFARAKGE